MQKKHKIKKSIFISTDVLYGLYVELIDCFYASKEIIEFCEEYPILYKVLPLVDICNTLIHLVKNGENDLEKIINNLKNLVEEEGDIVYFDVNEKFLRDLVDYLDKNKIIKVKGNKVKLV
jgi:hypothetical protein